MDEEEYNEGKGGTDSHDDENKDSDQQSDDEQEDSPRDTQDRHNDDDDHQIFNEEDIQNLRDIFDLFDKDQSGKIESTDLENILTSLKRDPEEAKEMLHEIDPNHDGQITFEEFIKLMTKVENKIDRRDDGEEHDSTKAGEGGQKSKGGVKRTALIDFLVLLEDYRTKCESEGKYAEARK